jgi:hypothetical protein
MNILSTSISAVGKTLIFFHLVKTDTTCLSCLYDLSGNHRTIVNLLLLTVSNQSSNSVVLLARVLESVGDLLNSLTI